MFRCPRREAVGDLDGGGGEGGEADRNHGQRGRSLPGARTHTHTHMHAHTYAHTYTHSGICRLEADVPENREVAIQTHPPTFTPTPTPHKIPTLSSFLVLRGWRVWRCCTGVSRDRRRRTPWPSSNRVGRGTHTGTHAHAQAHTHTRTNTHTHTHTLTRR